jgi:uncharacterized membrane protein
MKKLSRGRLFLILPALLGIVDSVLVHNKIIHDTGACVVFTGCQDVLHSSYATLLGISLAWWGLAFYISLALILFWWATSERARVMVYLWCAGGLVFSFYLLGVQALALHEFCSYCLGSFVLVNIISGVVFFGKTSLPDRRSADLQS